MANEERKDFNAMLADDKGMPRIQIITDEASIRRYDGSRMYLAPPRAYDRIMRRVPFGNLTTVGDIRALLARRAGADFTDPITAGIFVSIAAWASFQRAGDETPWWRTLRANGELNPKYPGGIEAQRARLEAEGHRIVRRGGRIFGTLWRTTSGLGSTCPRQTLRSARREGIQERIEMKKREIDAFEGMMRTAREWLEGRAPEELARNAGVAFDGSGFALNSLGEEIRVSFPEYEIEPKLDPWRQMVLLHYLKLADGAPLANRLIGFAELRSGLARGGDFDRRCEAVIRQQLGGLDPEELRTKCASLGARMLDSNADLCAEFPYLPRFPLTLKLWFADEEFPASGRLMLDASADHYLTIEDAVTAGQLLMYKLAGAF